MNALHDDPAWLDRARHAELTLLLDLDGSLIPFADTPEQATLDHMGMSLLRELTETGVRVVIVSGRPQPLMERERVRVGARGIWWYAEHGTWRYIGAGWEGPPEELSPVVQSLVEALSSVASAPGLRFEIKSHSLCIHWRLVASELRDAAIAAIAIACEEWLSTHPDYERLEGVEMFEIRKRSANKGVAAKQLRGALPGALMLAVGDDDTDEDMFAALGAADVAICVRNGRNRRTRARVALSDPGAVREFLWWIVAARKRSGLMPLPRFDVVGEGAGNARGGRESVHAASTSAHERQVTTPTPGRAVRATK